MDKRQYIANELRRVFAEHTEIASLSETVAARMADAAIAALKPVTAWQPIETAPEGEPHLRGMWVYSAMTGKPVYFAANCGYIDEDGAFVDMKGDDEFGWSPDDYCFWAPIPLPLPAPPPALGRADLARISVEQIGQRHGGRNLLAARDEKFLVSGPVFRLLPGGKHPGRADALAGYLRAPFLAHLANRSHLAPGLRKSCGQGYAREPRNSKNGWAKICG